MKLSAIVSAIQDTAKHTFSYDGHAMLAECEGPDIIEGYEHQSNASGTGIVSMGHYSWMNAADLDLVEVSEEVSK